jgi:peptide/nickel transport system substrate-binding protein
MRHFSGFSYIGLLGALAASAVVLAVVLGTTGGGVGGRAESGPYGPPVPADAAAVRERRGALLDEIVFTQETDLGRVTELIAGGSQHVFAQGITNPTVFRNIRESPRIDYEIAYGSSADLTMNPFGPHFQDGRINPFHVREIREAMNWLIDRDYIVDEIYGGLAVPRYLALNTVFPDYARLAETARALEIRYRYAPERAREVIHREMRSLGATFEQGRWIHDGTPVRLTILIRTDDERLRIGDYVANQLEDLGFPVERLYRTADEASRIWIAGDPAVGRWHLYTGGWVSTAILRDLADQFNYYYTHRGRPEPLWQVYEPDPRLDRLAERLQRRDYETWEERLAMMAEATELAIEDSVRIWLVDRINVLPRVTDLEVAVDLAGGIAGASVWPYTMRFRGRVGGRAVVGLPNVMTEPWNPIAGSNWVFDLMVLRALRDATVLTDPFTGLMRPQRIAHAEVAVAGGVPVNSTLDWLTLEHVERIDVPADAWLAWDVRERRFVMVGETHPDGLTARTGVRLRFDDTYFEQRWHDGTTTSAVDVIMPFILSFERGSPDSPLHDATATAPFEVFRQHFRGWRIVSTEPLVVEVWSDQVFPDAEWIVSARAPSMDLWTAELPWLTPWHSVAIGILAERQGELSFSSSKADRQRIDWMNYVAGPSLAILARHLASARAESFVPFADALAPYLAPGEVESRYAALERWYAERGHFWVGNGPYYLHSVHPVERSVVLRRFEDFPDPSDRWLAFTRPRIPVADIDGPLLVAADRDAQFELDVSFDGAPYPTESIERIRYLVFDNRSNLAIEGDATAIGDGRWQIVLDTGQIAALGTGANSLEVAVTSLDVALPVFVTHAFATVPPGGRPAGSGPSAR